MSSPNEPGGQWAGDGGRQETGAPAPRSVDAPDVPPWQRAAAGRGQQSGPRPPVDQPPRPPQEAPRPPEPVRPVEATRPVENARPPVEQPRPVDRPNLPAPPADSRINRYVTGTAAPSALQQQKPQPVPESEAARTKEFASELPDLSGAPVRSGQTSGRTEAPAANTAARTPGGRVQVGTRAKGGPVRASMQIRRVDPWSALKVSLLLSVALFFVWMIAVALLYLVLGGMGVWSKLNSNVGDLLTSTGGSGGELVSASSIFGGALLIGLVNIVLLTAMATIGAFVYNLATDIVGGVEVTLADRD